MAEALAGRAARTRRDRELKSSRAAFGMLPRLANACRGERAASASNSEQVQGDEFKHITVVLDKKFCPAAGYTALSRVQRP